MVLATALPQVALHNSAGVLNCQASHTCTMACVLAVVPPRVAVHAAVTPKVRAPLPALHGLLNPVGCPICGHDKGHHQFASQLKRCLHSSTMQAALSVTPLSSCPVQQADTADLAIFPQLSMGWQHLLWDLMHQLAPAMCIVGVARDTCT